MNIEELLAGKLVSSIWFMKSLCLAVSPLLYIAPDRVSSSDAYARRFRGPLGRWHLGVQRDAILSMLAPWPQAAVLDVGGGHGQYAEDLVANRYRLTVLGSDPETSHRIAPLVSSGKCQFEVGHFLKLPHDDRSFEGVVSMRQLSHLADWETFLAELCRVAKHAVIIDFPVIRSFNFASRLLFPLKRKIENDTTRPFIVFDEKQVIEVLRRQGFVPTDRMPQFFLPMALHRLIRWVPPIQLLEWIFRCIGMTRRFGSPVILRAERAPV
jgi:SAM-dependent methyltransferase